VNVVTSYFLDARKRVQDQIRQEMMMTLVPLRSRKTIAAIFMAIGLFAVACGADATATPIPPTTIPAPTSAPVVAEPTEPPQTLISSEIQGGDPDFNVDVLVWQSYWLSRDQFGPFVMASGMGSPALVNDPRDFDLMNFEAFRLNPDSSDTTISVQRSGRDDAEGEPMG
jgi:hypothetical protein